MSDKCPSCGQEMFQVYFNDDSLYEGVTYKRCMDCNLLIPFKKEKTKKDSKKPKK